MWSLIKKTKTLCVYVLFIKVKPQRGYIFFFFLHNHPGTITNKPFNLVKIWVLRILRTQDLSWAFLRSFWVLRWSLWTLRICSLLRLICSLRRRDRFVVWLQNSLQVCSVVLDLIQNCPQSNTNLSSIQYKLVLNLVQICPLSNTKLSSI